MTARCIMIIAACAALAWGQFPPPVSGEEMPFDSSDIMADMIIKSKAPVLIDFWAPWCRPCRIVSPIIDELKGKYAGKIKVMKINVDAHRRIAAYFRVSAIPAVFFIKDKAVVLYLPGMRPKEDYESAIKSVLAMKPEQPDTTQKQQPAPQQPAKKAPPTGK